MNSQSQRDDFNFLFNLMDAATECPLCERMTMQPTGVCLECQHQAVLPHTCSCGRVTERIPHTAKLQYDMDDKTPLFWMVDCVCKSTMAIPVKA